MGEIRTVIDRCLKTLILEIGPRPAGPSLALTSAGAFAYGLQHTPQDRLDQVDPARIERTVRFLGDLIRSLQKMPVQP